MKWDIILELMDGRREEATLARPFLPEKNEIKVIVAGVGHVQTYSLSKVCCVLMLPKSHQVKLSTKEQSLEEVITVTGNHYIVNVIENMQIHNGFYGLSTDANNPFKFIFFTKGGVKVRRQQRGVGEILEDKGLLTKFSIEKVLSGHGLRPMRFLKI